MLLMIMIMTMIDAIIKMDEIKESMRGGGGVESITNDNSAISIQTCFTNFCSRETNGSIGAVN